MGVVITRVKVIENYSRRGKDTYARIRFYRSVRCGNRLDAMYNTDMIKCMRKLLPQILVSLKFSPDPYVNVMELNTKWMSNDEEFLIKNIKNRLVLVDLDWED